MVGEICGGDTNLWSWHLLVELVLTYGGGTNFGRDANLWKWYQLVEMILTCG